MTKNLDPTISVFDYLKPNDKCIKEDEVSFLETGTVTPIDGTCVDVNPRHNAIYIKDDIFLISSDKIKELARKMNECTKKIQSWEAPLASSWGKSIIEWADSKLHGNAVGPLMVYPNMSLATRMMYKAAKLAGYGVKIVGQGVSLITKPIQFLLSKIFSTVYDVIYHGAWGLVKGGTQEGFKDYKNFSSLEIDNSNVSANIKECFLNSKSIKRCQKNDILNKDWQRPDKVGVLPCPKTAIVAGEYKVYATNGDVCKELGLGEGFSIGAFEAAEKTLTTYTAAIMSSYAVISWFRPTLEDIAGKRESNRFKETDSEQKVSTKSSTPPTDEDFEKLGEQIKELGLGEAFAQYDPEALDAAFPLIQAEYLALRQASILEDTAINSVEQQELIKKEYIAADVVSEEEEIFYEVLDSLPDL